MWLVSHRRQGILTQEPAPDPKCDCNIVPYTSKSITLLHLCQGYHGHCIVTSSDGEMGRVRGEGWFIYVRVWVGGQRVGIIFFLLFVPFLCYCKLFFHGWYMIACCVCFIILFLLSLSLVPLIRCC